MARPAIHTCAEVPGATRTSPRTYTHAVIAEYDRAEAEASARAYVTACAKDGYRYHQTRAALPDAGGVYPGYGFPVTAAEVAESRAFLVEHPLLEVYIAKDVATHLERLAQDGTPAVLQWSMSEKAARNALGSLANRHPSYRNLRVVPVQRGVDK